MDINDSKLAFSSSDSEDSDMMMSDHDQLRLPTVGIDTHDNDVFVDEHDQEMMAIRSSFLIRFLLSTTWMTIYIVLLLVQFFLLIYSLQDSDFRKGDEEREVWYVILDIGTTIALCLEVLVRIIVIRNAFWSDTWNVADFVLAVFCASTLAIYLFDGSEREDHINAIILFCRYGAQALRVCMFLRSHAHRKRMAEASNTTVDFSRLTQQDDSEGIEMSRIDMV